ncbi:hypothetical protein CAOG_06625 [Capsaspora owczarzaki ATCC 30864]|uniref:Glycosyltransferase family 92 protein n=1 Tax=Capsaspora owczarzaki (strain ATCC 30864) TaxID=595528 RepID=A0A0D2VXB8_CAPO3|nr:hypothetical protein CAOG_06625 [Capsaspora owczarzaki ATCC 30864]KJE96282.1 hypothetical protein CAOG_006625 [Capsaspora owczarzaki ATCC 30864]|eukprot:XP_004344246.1 hypothetical protein CAOG_06625 [Capsaspora owczarzaki ATCC 30864]
MLGFGLLRRRRRVLSLLLAACVLIGIVVSMNYSFDSLDARRLRNAVTERNPMHAQQAALQPNRHGHAGGRHPADEPRDDAGNDSDIDNETERDDERDDGLVAQPPLFEPRLSHNERRRLAKLDLINKNNNNNNNNGEQVPPQLRKANHGGPARPQQQQQVEKVKANALADLNARLANAAAAKNNENQNNEAQDKAEGVGRDPVQGGPPNRFSDVCDPWCSMERRAYPPPAAQPYFLTGVLLMRIYDEDKADLTFKEMLQWIAYMQYAGVEHIYVYDAYFQSMPHEKQEARLKPYIDGGYITYYDWSRYNPYSIDGTQVRAYQDCLTRHGRESTWTVAMDIDEYPFVLQDFEPGFFARYIREYSKKNPHVSEITAQNFLFLEGPIPKAQNDLLMERIRRRTPHAHNALVKPTYRNADLGGCQVHHNYVRTGSSQDAPPSEYRMNHMWGARLQNWNPITPKSILDMTVADDSMLALSARVSPCICYPRTGVRDDV